MPNGVYVLPVQLLSGVYCDLHDTEEGLIGFKFEKDGKVVDGELKFLMKLKFDCPSPRSATGHIHLEVSGERLACGAEAERSAVLGMIAALRTEHGFFPADYNYVIISEQRKLFEAMRAAVGNLRSKYDQVETILLDAKSALDEMCRQITQWTAHTHVGVDVADIVAVCSFQTVMRDRIAMICNDADHSRNLVNLIQNRNADFPELRRFEETVPMPMNIDWAGSYFLLRLIYCEAIRKIKGEVYDIICFHAPGVGYKACVGLSVAPYKFWSPNADSDFAARSKLMFEVIKYVNKNLGHPIIDLHHHVKVHYEVNIERFDHKMDNIECCGLKLRQVFQGCYGDVRCAIEKVYASLAVSAASEPILHGIAGMSTRLASLAASFGDAWAAFVTAKVNAEEVKSSVNTNA